MHAYTKVFLVLIIIGGINWGLVGLFDFNLVAWLFGGAQSIWSRAIFTIVGIAALCAIPGVFAPGPHTPHAPQAQ